MVADPLRSRSRRKLRRSLTGAQLDRMLNDPAVIEAWGAAAVQDELRKLRKRRRNLDRDVPSATWADDHWHHRANFPPGGDQTGMERCVKCERYTPRPCIGSSGACDDCRLGAMSRMQLEALPSSPGCVVDFHSVKGGRKRHSVG